jgi:hypothetical protein
MRSDRHTVVLLIRPDDAPELTDDEAVAIQEAHLANQAALIERGLVVASGPVVNQDDDRVRELAVLSVDGETARALFGVDPAVRIGRLAVEVVTWLVPEGSVQFGDVRAPRSTGDASAADGDPDPAS